jgi:hypothetical protein
VTPGVGRSPSLGFDASSSATGLGLITGALSIVEPFLAVLTATLTSIAVAAWVLGRPRGANGRRRWAEARTLGAIGAVAIGGAIYLDPPALILPFRALLLSLLLLPLYWDARAHRTIGAALREQT